MSRPWELCRVCSLISRISFRSRSEAGKIKFFLTSRSSRGLWRPALYIGPGASWGQGWPGAGLRPGAGQPDHCRAKHVLAREREEAWVGGPGSLSKRDPIPIPGTSLAHQVRLGLWAFAGRGDLAPALSVGLSAVCSRCGLEGGRAGLIAPLDGTQGEGRSGLT